MCCPGAPPRGHVAYYSQNPTRTKVDAGGCPKYKQRNDRGMCEEEHPLSKARNEESVKEYCSKEGRHGTFQRADAQDRAMSDVSSSKQL